MCLCACVYVCVCVSVCVCVRFEMNDGADDALLDVYGTPQDKERLVRGSCYSVLCYVINVVCIL